MGKNRYWTKEEIEFLQDKWGSMNVKTIAKNLNRSVDAVMLKKNRLGLGRFTESGDYITFNTLMKALGHGNSGYRYKETSWIKNRGCPVETKTIKNRKIRVIKIDKFWKWAYDNRTFLDFSKFEKHILGAEPAWVDKKRRADISKNIKIKTTKWTEKEDEYLKYLLKQFKYSYDEIGNRLNRSSSAVKRRMHDLKLKERGIKEVKHLWTDKEHELMLELIKSGDSLDKIAEKLDRSTSAIRGRLYRIFKTESIEKVLKTIEYEGNYV